MKKGTVSDLKNLLLFTQLGLSVVSPVLFLGGAGYLMQTGWHTPGWLTVVLIGVGLLSGLLSAWKLLRRMASYSRQNDPEPTQLDAFRREDTGQKAEKPRPENEEDRS